jgi:transcriptional regulator with XRE-family HTH domain
MLGRSRPISKSTVSRWEHDEQIPRRAVLDVIAQLGREVGVALPSQPTAGVVQAVVARAVALLSDPTHREAHAGAVARWTAELDRILPTAQSNAVGDVCRDPLLIGAVVAAVVPGVSAAPERLELRDLATGTRLLVSAAVGELMIPRP